jgi:hypothetical protein
VKPEVFCLVHDPHATTAEHFMKPIVSDRSSGHGRPGL